MDKDIFLGVRPAIQEIAKIMGQGTIGVEVGVNKGFNAGYICQVVKPKILYLIDPWNNFLDPASGEIIGEAQFLMAKALLKKHECCRFIRDTSYNAVKQFEDESVDFVYIDSDHWSVLREAHQWYPKVRKGGILGGHDILQPQVERAVIDFCKENKIDTFYNCPEDWWIKK